MRYLEKTCCEGVIGRPSKHSTSPDAVAYTTARWGWVALVGPTAMRGTGVWLTIKETGSFTGHLLAEWVERLVRTAGRHRGRPPSGAGSGSGGGRSSGRRSAAAAGPRGGC